MADFLSNDINYNLIEHFKDDSSSSGRKRPSRKGDDDKLNSTRKHSRPGSRKSTEWGSYSPSSRNNRSNREESNDDSSINNDKVKKCKKNATFKQIVAFSNNACGDSKCSKAYQDICQEYLDKNCTAACQKKLDKIFNNGIITIIILFLFIIWLFISKQQLQKKIKLLSL